MMDKCSDNQHESADAAQQDGPFGMVLGAPRFGEDGEVSSLPPMDLPPVDRMFDRSTSTMEPEPNNFAPHAPLSPAMKVTSKKVRHNAKTSRTDLNIVTPDPCSFGFAQCYAVCLRPNPDKIQHDTVSRCAGRDQAEADQYS